MTSAPSAEAAAAAAAIAAAAAVSLFVFMQALPVGDAALANEFARVAANGDRISCGDAIV